MIPLRLLVLLLFCLVTGGGMLVAQTFQPAPPAPVLPVPGTYTYYGTGCGMYSNPPQPQWFSRLTASGRPVLGGTVRVHHYIQQPLRDWRLQFAILLTGSSATRVGGLPLPLDLNRLFPSLYQPGCLLYTSGELDGLTHWGSGSVDYRIPTDPSLLGLTLYQQWSVAIWDSFIQGGWSQVSNGGMMVIGR